MEDEEGRKPIIHPEDDVEIEFFDEDPDGDADRAGDGYYYQVAGDDSWAGAYHSVTEAEEAVRESLEHWDMLGAYQLFPFGFRNLGTSYCVVKDDLDAAVRMGFVVEKDRVYAYTQFGKVVIENNVPALVVDGNRTVLDTVEIDPELETYGHRRAAVMDIYARLDPSYRPASANGHGEAPKTP